MPENTPFLPREHNFSVAVSKHFFLHDDYGLVITDPIRVDDAKGYGLKSIILYNISVRHFSKLHWTFFSAFDDPRPLMEVLFEGWEKSECLRGRPDILCITTQLEAACPTLSNNLEKLSVTLKPVTDDKPLAASLRTAQKRIDSQLPLP
jgi:hypothetical protein